MNFFVLDPFYFEALHQPNTWNGDEGAEYKKRPPPQGLGHITGW